MYKSSRAGAGGAPPISVTSSDSEGGRTPLLTLDRLRVRKILLALLALAGAHGGANRHNRLASRRRAFAALRSNARAAHVGRALAAAHVGELGLVVVHEVVVHDDHERLAPAERVHDRARARADGRARASAAVGARQLLDRNEGGEERHRLLSLIHI